ncbi:hypothetical protein O3G_MSEX006016, partial [Manduca sexta]
FCSYNVISVREEEVRARSRYRRVKHIEIETDILKYLNIISKMLKVISSIKFVLLYRFCLGLYYEMGPSKVVQYFGKMYCILLLFLKEALYTYDLLINSYSFSILFHRLISMILILVVPLASVVNKEIHFMKYMLELNDHSRDFRENLNSIIPFIVTVTGLTYKITMAVFIYTKHTYFMKFLPSFIAMFSYYPYYYTYIVMYHVLYNEMKVLQRKLRVGLTEDLTEDEKINVIQRFRSSSVPSVIRFLFKTLNKPSKTIRITLSFGVVTQWLRMMNMAYYNISENFQGITDALFGVFYESMVIFLPAILLEMSHNVADDFKHILSKQLLQYQDYRLRQSVYDSLDYINTHSMKFSLWFQYSMDISLLIRYATFGTTFIISLLQFKY